MAAGMTKYAILKRLKLLSEQHGFSYTTVTQAYRLYAELVPETAYSIMALQWTSSVPQQRDYKVREGSMPKPKQPGLYTG